MDFVNRSEVGGQKSELAGASLNSDLRLPTSDLSEGRRAYEQSKERERERRKLQNAVKQVEQEIEALEQQLAEKDALLASGAPQDAAFYDEYQRLKKLLESKMEAWEEAVIRAEEA